MGLSVTPGDDRSCFKAIPETTVAAPAKSADKPVYLEDTRTEYELKYPQIFSGRLLQEGYKVRGGASGDRTAATMSAAAFFSRVTTSAVVTQTVKTLSYAARSNDRLRRHPSR